MSATIDKIRSFGGLHKSMRSEPHIIELAIAAEKMLRNSGYPETDAFPGENVIQVTGYLNRVCLQIEISEEAY